MDGCIGKERERREASVDPAFDALSALSLQNYLMAAGDVRPARSGSDDA